VGDFVELESKRCSKFAVRLLVICGGVFRDFFGSLISKAVEFLMGFLVLFAVPPGVMPIDVRGSTRRGSDPI
jgi:hypothetical protein